MLLAETDQTAAEYRGGQSTWILIILALHYITLIFIL